MHIAERDMIIAAWRNGLNTFDIARKFNLSEALAYSMLHRALDCERATNSATSSRPKPPGSAPPALPGASGPGGNPLAEKTTVD